jgi:tRNA-specific 2-thiouridylase
VHGQSIGEHNGAHFFTIGQRKGLDIGGFPEPLFVIGVDVTDNQVFVGMGKNHPGLFRRVLKIGNDEVHWIRPDLMLKVGESRRLMVRIRYRQPLQQAVLHQRDNGLFIVFDQPQRGIASGQFAAWYEGEELTGSGVIS